MIEVEVKVRADHKKVLDIIIGRKCGIPESAKFEFIRTEHQNDIYFNAPDRDFKDTDEALRIRSVDGVGEITYKGKRFDALSKTRPEFNSPADEYNMTQILLALGYRISGKVEKVRDFYEYSENSGNSENFENPENSENPENFENPENPKNSENFENPENSENPEIGNNSMTFCFDKIEGLGEFLEIEIDLNDGSSKEDVSEATEKIFSILSKFGLSKEDSIRTSYLELVMENSEN